MIIMEITQEEYNRISKIEDNDDAFEETLKLLEPYLEKYKEFYKTNNFNITRLQESLLRDGSRIAFAR